MIKVLDSDELRKLDIQTIQDKSISSLDLMEQAADAFVRWFVQRFNATHKIGVICGTGNNGGDGLAIARLLKNWCYPVKVWFISGGKESEDFKANKIRLSGDILGELNEVTDLSIFDDRHILIDGIFGIGLSRQIEGVYATVIDALNKTKAIRLAIDVPSGLHLERHSYGHIVRAHYTLTFQVPKLAFFLPENFRFVGDWQLLDIGLSEKALELSSAPAYFLTKADIKKRLKVRSRFDHKGKNGKALLVAGSFGKMGASVLAARAALRSGVGLLTVHTPSEGYSIIQTAVPEAMASIDSNSNSFSDPLDVAEITGIGVGPGIGQSKETVNAFSKLLNRSKPMVIDADALNIISMYRELLLTITPGSILTPHPKEFERMVDAWANDFERLEKQKKLSIDLKSVVVLKGAYTSITSPEGIVYFNSTGNPGMATGGTGDVLTGILTSLLAQGYSAIDSALIGVYIHGLAGDLAAREKGMDSLIASDLVDFLPNAYLKVRS